MKFGRTLRLSMYEPWHSHYLNYAKLKQLLREDEQDDDDPSYNMGDRDRGWTDDDESAFVEELLNVQLEKVNTFHAETIKQLRERTSECEQRLERHTSVGDLRQGSSEDDGTTRSVENELDRSVLLIPCPAPLYYNIFSFQSSFISNLAAQNMLAPNKADVFYPLVSPRRSTSLKNIAGSIIPAF